MKKLTRTIYRLSLSLILAISFLSLTNPGAAQTPTPTPPTTPVPETGDQAPSINLALSDWGYEDVLLNGPYGYASYDIGLPQHWKMQSGSSISLELNYVYTERTRLVSPASGAGVETYIAIANIWVRLNEILIYQTNLTEQGPHTLTFPIPDTWPERISERDRLEVFFHVYGPCENTQYSSLTIFKESNLNLNYVTDPLSLVLATYPSPFFQRTFLPNAVLIALPENATKPLVEAGLSIASGLGNLSNDRVVITTTSTLDQNPGIPFSENGIIIGTPDNSKLLAYLNDNYELRAPFRTRQYELTISGPDVATPASSLTYQIQAKNSEPEPAGDISLRVELPQGIGEFTCEPDCQKVDNQATWDTGSLAPAAIADYTITFNAPETNDSEPIYVTAELLQEQSAINVSTLQTRLETGVESKSQVSQPPSDFFFLQDGHAVAETDGVIQLLPSPWQPDKALLIVSGLTDEAVLKAGRAVGMLPSFPGMVGQTAFVQNLRPSGEPLHEQTLDVTLAELGYQDITITGTGLKEIYYNFDLPLGWAFTNEAYVRLLFTHSPLLDPERSAITLFFNTTPIASVALDERNATAGELVGPLPANSSRPGRANTLLVRIQLMLPDPCADPESSESWLRIDSQSSLHLAHSEKSFANYMNLEFWPLPFIANSNLSDVLFALPENPSDIEYTQAVRISSYLGASTAQDNFQPSASLGVPSDLDRSSHHLITVGRPTRNPLLQAANEYLPQPFWLGTDGIQQKIDDVVFHLPDNIDLGYLQFIPSPWSAEHALLAVTGTSDVGVEQAASFLVDSEQNWQLQGDLVLLKAGKAMIANLGDFTLQGQLTEIATLLPEATVVGTATPTPRQTPVAPTLAAETTSDESTFYPQRFPYLVPLVVGGGILAILVIMIVSYIQSRKSRDRKEP
jgi:Bacterial cellulose synthase subunit